MKKENPLDRWDDFVGLVWSRMKMGERMYGNGSFHRPGSEIERELEEELLDVAGWAYVRWWQLRRAREEVGKAKQSEPDKLKKAREKKQ